MSGDGTIRVLIADDHPLILDGMEQLFRTDPRYRVIARCRNGQEALERIQQDRPEIAIVDLRMPELSGLEVLEAVAASTRFVLLTAEIDDARIVKALNLGVRGIILKERAAELLLDCVDVVLEGERWIDPDIAGRALRLVDQASASKPAVPLSPREIEITRGVAAGFRNREIAERLFISEGTVKTHLRTIFEKTGVESRMALVNWARRHGLVD